MSTVFLILALGHHGLTTHFCARLTYGSGMPKNGFREAKNVDRKGNNKCWPLRDYLINNEIVLKYGPKTIGNAC